MTATTASTGKLRTILGAMEFGRRMLTVDGPCHEIMDAYLSRGYQEIDTAIMYNGGEAEKIMGRFTPCRDPDKVLLATKANPSHPERLRRDGVIQQLEKSLESLQVSSIDLFYLHSPDHETPIEETLAAVQELHAKGKFKEFGLSTTSHGKWMVEGELFPCLRRFNMRFYAYNILAGGILTNNYKFSEADEKQRSGRFWGGNNNIWEAKYRERYWRESIFTGVDCIKESLNGAYGSDKVSIADAAVRWMVHHSQLDPKYGDGIIVGGSSLEHITDNLDALHHESLDPNVVKAFDQAWEYDKANCATYFR